MSPDRSTADRVQRQGLSPTSWPRLVLQGLALWRRAFGQERAGYGDVPEHANDYSEASLKLPRGAIINGNLKEVFPVDHADPEQIQEYVTHSWYKYPDESKGLHPWDGSPSRITSSAPRPRARRRISKSSTRAANIPGSRRRAGVVMPWKSARSRWIVGYAQGKPEFKEPVDKVLKDSWPADRSTVLDARSHGRPRAGIAMGRYQMRHFQNKLIANIKNGDSATAFVDKWKPETWPKEVKGVGFTEAPARCARPLDQDQGRQDRQLSVRRADHLETVAHVTQGQYRRLRGLAHGYAHG